MKKEIITSFVGICLSTSYMTPCVAMEGTSTESEQQRYISLEADKIYEDIISKTSGDKLKTLKENIIKVLTNNDQQESSEIIKIIIIKMISHYNRGSAYSYVKSFWKPSDNELYAHYLITLLNKVYPGTSFDDQIFQEFIIKSKGQDILNENQLIDDVNQFSKLCIKIRQDQEKLKVNEVLLNIINIINPPTKHQPNFLEVTNIETNKKEIKRLVNTLSPNNRKDIRKKISEYFNILIIDLKKDADQGKLAPQLMPSLEKRLDDSFLYIFPEKKGSETTSISEQEAIAQGQEVAPPEEAVTPEKSQNIFQEQIGTITFLMVKQLGKAVLFIEGEDGELYCTINLKDADVFEKNKQLMEFFSQFKSGKKFARLEGKKIQFKETGESIQIDGKTYKTVDITRYKGKPFVFKPPRRR